MASLSLPRARGRFHDLPLAVKSITGFWLLYLLTIVVRGGLTGAQVDMLLGRRLLGIVLGIVLTFLIYFLLRLFASRGTLRRMIIVAALACLPSSIALAAFTFTFISMHRPQVTQQIVEETKDGSVLRRSPEGEITVQTGPNAPPVVFQAEATRDIIMQQAPRYIADGAVTWYFFFAAWAAFYVAMTSAGQLRLAERRASEFERAAQSAQLRALRYQVNPHFLFNTLNSLSSLIMAKREEEAERMIMNLSNFFRSTLSIDPTADVSLAEEIELQMLYLNIEKARFPKRLKVEVDIPDPLRIARVPALLLQPIVENAIKYGVARARNAVTLAIRAEKRERDMLRITIENGGPQMAEAPDDEKSGTGVGLVNVCQRLAARFGERASCAYGPRPEGGYRVTLDMPLVTHG